MNASHVRSDAANALRAAMGEQGVSVAELARRSGVSKATIHRIFDERYAFVPTSRTLTRLWDGLGARTPPTAAPAAPLPIALSQLPNGKARLQLDIHLPFATALQILALVEEASK